VVDSIEWRPGIRQLASWGIGFFKWLSLHPSSPHWQQPKKARRMGHTLPRLLDTPPQPPESLSQVADSRMHIIVERSGAKRRPDELLVRSAHIHATLNC
jgi:hypothetical protein